MKHIAIILAGGVGKRMGGAMPKQFLSLGDRAILQRTIERFLAACPDIKVITVLPEDHMAWWRQYCRDRNFNCPQRLVPGGFTRFHSVKNALDRVPEKEESLVAVHDGVRPFVSEKTISTAFDEAALSGCAIPVADAVDSIREVTEGGSVVRDRSKIKLVQTPQVFRSSLLKEAYHQDYCDAFTDDASVVEAAGFEVVLTAGNRENIKITTPFDLKVAEALVKL